MTNADWSSTALDVYLGEQSYLEVVYPADAASLNIESNFQIICHGTRCETFKARMGGYVSTCASVAEFRAAAYVEVVNMAIYADFEKTKARYSGKSHFTLAAPNEHPDVADTSKRGAPYKAFKPRLYGTPIK
jgi:hypothetical protein